MCITTPLALTLRQQEVCTHVLFLPTPNGLWKLVYKGFKPPRGSKGVCCNQGFLEGFREKGSLVEKHML